MLSARLKTERRESALKIKDEIYKKRSEFELEMKRDRVELDRLQNKLNQNMKALRKKNNISMNFAENFKKKSVHLLRKEDALRANENKLKLLYNDLISKLRTNQQYDA